jgi:hypothetical protein
MVARQALQQDRGLLQDRRVDLDIAKAGTRRRKRGLGKRGLGKPNVGETCDLLRRYAEDVRGDIAESPNSG